MAFTVPNEASASYTDQSEIDSVDLKVISVMGMRTGVNSGCAVTAQGSPDDTVAISSGTYFVDGVKKTCAGGNVNVLSGAANPDGTTSSAANATYFRYDLITANSSSQLGVIHGTVPAPAWPDYAVNPVFPDFTATTHAVLAAILIPPTAASITGIPSSLITRKDQPLSDPEHLITSASVHTAGWGGKGYLLHGLTSTTGGTVAPGTNGQILTAQSGQSSGLLWATPATGMATDTLWDAKGDLAAASAADTGVKLSVGTVGQVLSGESTNGVYWQNSWEQVFLPTGAIAETMPRQLSPSTNLNQLTSNQMFLSPIYLPRGATITSITFVSGTTALVAGTTPHFWAALYSSGLVLRRQSTDDTSPVWGASATHTFTLSSTYVTTVGGLHFLGLMAGAASGNTVPSLRGMANSAGTTSGLGPALLGTGGTALGATAPDPASTPTGSGVGIAYAYVS